MNEKVYPKLLIISHNLFDTSNNIGKTLVSLLDGWPKDRISQIFFRNDKPSFNYCSEYYCVTDKEILKSTLSFGARKAGSSLTSCDDSSVSATENSLYTIGNHRNPIVSLIRDTLWCLSNWKTYELSEWLLTVAKPDLILFVPNDYCLAYRFALYVERIVNKPIVPFYMDDAFYWNCKTSFIDDYRRKELRKLAAKIHEYSGDILTICDFMSEEYHDLFNRNCWAFANSVKVSKPRINDDLHNPIIFTYLGNLHSNRWKSLVEIANVLGEIEKRNGIKCELHVYSGSLLEDKMKIAFANNNYIKFMGSVKADQVRGKQIESDILVHVETFDTRSINSTRLSLSTKIPEYLSTGVPVFAYGPSNISSMKYLSKYELGQVCYQTYSLYATIKDILLIPELRVKLSNNGINRAKNYHNIDEVANRFQNILIKYKI